jgi:hypothetical protein
MTQIQNQKGHNPASPNLRTFRLILQLEKTVAPRRGSLLEFLLVFQAIDGPGYLFEPLLSDGSAVDLAFAVVAVFDALQGGLNLLQKRGVLICLFQRQA